MAEGQVHENGALSDAVNVLWKGSGECVYVYVGGERGSSRGSSRPKVEDHYNNTKHLYSAFMFKALHAH